MAAISSLHHHGRSRGRHAQNRNLRESLPGFKFHVPAGTGPEKG